MKTIRMGLYALLAIWMFSACSTPSDAVFETFTPVEEALTPQALAAELTAKMATSPWVEQTEEVSVAFGCVETAISYFSFEVIERVHKIFASDGQYYFVVGTILPGESNILDADGNSYSVEFVLNTPAPLKKGSNQLYQHMEFVLTGQGFMRVSKVISASNQGESCSWVMKTTWTIFSTRTTPIFIGSYLKQALAHAQEIIKPGRPSGLSTEP